MQTGQLMTLLPSLRRYAHCLCGTPREGDLLLEKALKQVRDEGVTAESDAALRRFMFRALHRVWIAVDGPEQRAEHRLTVRLSDLVPRDRAVFLLVRCEQFDLADAAAIAGMGEEEAEWRLRRADSTILSQQAKRRILIVEDEALTAMELEDLVEELGYQALGPAMTHSEAVAAARSGMPDLILSDIQLQDSSSGIDMVEEIRRDMDVPVVFVTAFPNRLMDRPLADQTYLASKPLNKTLLRGYIASALRASD